MRGAGWVALLLVLLLVTVEVPLPGPADRARAPERSALAVHPFAASPIGNYTPLSNVSSSQDGPGGSALPGDRVGYRFQVAIPGYNSSWGSVEVWFPPTVVNFDTLEGSLGVGTGARNLTVDSPGFTGGNLTGVLQTMTNLTAFRSQSSATFSTQQQAPMALTPPGTFALAIEWQWVVVVADGSVSNSSWNPVPPVEVNPDQYANLLSLQPRSVAPGGTVTGCLTGPISDRTFALRAVTVTPPVDFAGRAGTVPAGGAAQYCLSLTIPSSTPYEPVIVRLWDVVSPTSGYLLYAVRIHVANVTSAPSPLPWTSVVDLGVLGFGGLLVVACVLLWRRPSSGARAEGERADRSERRSQGRGDGPSDPGDPAPSDSDGEEDGFG